jgi:CRP-like cAMP-binding protein
MQIDLTQFGDPERPLLSLLQRTLILRGFSGFKTLEPEELALIASICRERFFAAGEVMHQEGAPVSAFHMVVDGDVQMYRNGRPQRVMHGRSTVGALASLARDPNGAQAVALTDVVALEVNREDMDEVFEDNFGVLQNVLVGLAHGVREFQIKAGGGAAMDHNHRMGRVDLSRSFTLVDKMLILKSATNFALVSLEALSQMARDADEVRFKAGARIWDRGAVADWSMLIVDGVVECIPESLPPFRLATSFYVGGVDSLTLSPRWYGCVAETDVVALKIHSHRFMDILEDHTDMALEMTRNFARGLMTALDKLMDGEEEAAAAQ